MIVLVKSLDCNIRDNNIRKTPDSQKAQQSGLICFWATEIFFPLFHLGDLNRFLGYELRRRPIAGFAFFPAHFRVIFHYFKKFEKYDFRRISLVTVLKKIVSLKFLYFHYLKQFNNVVKSYHQH